MAEAQAAISQSGAVPASRCHTQLEIPQRQQISIFHPFSAFLVGLGVLAAKSGTSKLYRTLNV